MRKIVFLCLLAVLGNQAFAADIEWSGLYRIEGASLYKPDLNDAGRQIDYALQHFIMRPKIIASDGLTIRSQFDIFNNAQYPDSHMGQLWGNNPRRNNPANTTTSADGSNVFSENGAAGTLDVSQLYLTWDFEYGSLIVGRAPLQFGLGMSYSAGMGNFDHWYDTLDMVGAKLVYGNFFVLPMIGKSSSGQIDRNDDVDDYLIQAQYENPEDDIEMGVIYHIRHASNQGSDAPMNTSYDTNGNPTGAPILGGPTPNNLSGVNIQRLNVFALKDSPRWRLGAEVGYQQGETGIRSDANPNSGTRVTLSGLGIAGELEWRPEESDWKFGLKAGYASGSDPANSNDFGGFIFNRNYDVAFMMFNHPMGQFDIFHTRLIGGGGGRPDSPQEISRTDVDAISNVIYIAPYINYRLNDKWSMKGILATGYLNQANYYEDPYTTYNSSGMGTTTPGYVGSGARDLGYEFDYSVTFSPRKGITWINEAGFLFPGDAWKGDGSFANGFAYGVQSRAAISF